MGSGSGSALPLPALGDNGAASGDSESSAREYSGEIDAVDVVGVSASELAAAASMARYVHKRASEMTADKATHTLDVGGRLRRCGHPRAHRPRASLNQRLDELRHPDPADRRRAELHQGGIRSRSA